MFGAEVCNVGEVVYFLLWVLMVQVLIELVVGVGVLAFVNAVRIV